MDKLCTMNRKTRKEPEISLVQRAGVQALLNRFVASNDRSPAGERQVEEPGFVKQLFIFITKADTTMCSIK
jgi:hypothetical protein